MSVKVGTKVAHQDVTAAAFIVDLSKIKGKKGDIHILPQAKGLVNLHTSKYWFSISC
jgi:hypothetical protein